MAQYLTDPVHRYATSLLSCLRHRKCYMFKHVDGKGGNFKGLPVKQSAHCSSIHALIQLGFMCRCKADCPCCQGTPVG